jgi:Polyketide cyclase / dehydrase and lipid transport
MLEFTESILVHAPAAAVWQVMQDVRRWWPSSNPEHESLEMLDGDGTLQVGHRIRIRETIAGVPGEATGTITDLKPGSLVTWEAPQARYRLLGIPVTVGEGVTWRVKECDAHSTTISARVWTTFPRSVWGLLVRTAFTRLLNGIEKDREHTRTELEYLKRTIEDGGP